MKWLKLDLCGIAFLLLLPGFALGQSVEHIVECTNLLKRETDAIKSNQWAMVVDSARQYVSFCSDRDTKLQLANKLANIGRGLIEQNQSEDAIPVLRRGIEMEPDCAGCWFLLGVASCKLGRISEAKTFFRKTIATGGFDVVNAAAIEAAKSWLAELEKSFPAKRDSAPHKSGKSGDHSFGTGFFVSDQGHILTNSHVVAGCGTLTTRDGKRLRVLSRNTHSDLALLKADFAPNSAAVFRFGAAPQLGDSVVAFGFPLPGLLSSEGNVSTGILSATSGLGDDVRFVQISAPVQPGNSGGPLFDSSGHVIGVVVAKLDALKVARATGDVPQNVNFAVHWSEVRAFLDEQAVPYRKETSQRATSTRDTAALASRISVAIDCTVVP